MASETLFAAAARESKAQCGRCGHSLAGLVEPTCPECGTGLAVAIVSSATPVRVMIPAWWASLAGTLFGAVHLIGWLWLMWSMYAPLREMALSLGQQPFGFWNYLQEVVNDWSTPLQLAVAALLCLSGTACIVARWANRAALPRWEQSQAAFSLVAMVFVTLVTIFL